MLCERIKPDIAVAEAFVLLCLPVRVIVRPVRVAWEVVEVKERGADGKSHYPALASILRLD